MASSRRKYLRMAGVVSLPLVSGCQSVLSSSKADTKTKMRVTDPDIPDNAPLAFSSKVIRDIGTPSPPKVELTLRATTDNYVNYGGGGPFSAPTLTAIDGESEILVVPDFGPDEYHWIQPADTDTESFVPTSKEECWTANADSAIVYQSGGEAQQTRAYYVLNSPSNAGCFPTSEYRAQDEVTIGGRSSTEGETYAWGFTIAFS